MIGPQTINQTFALLERAAVEGRRCPMNASPEVKGEVAGGAVAALAKAGRIRIEISGQNFRQVTILIGPHKGKKTAPNPNKRRRVWKVIDANGSRYVAATAEAAA